MIIKEMVPDARIELARPKARDFDGYLSVFTVDGLYHHLNRGLDAVSLTL